MKNPYEMSKSDIERFVGEIDATLACRGRSCLEEAFREYAVKNDFPSDESGCYQLKEIYDNHKALHR